MNEKIFILTDSCMWEANKQNKTKRSSHAVQVIDADTGQVRYINSGSKITLIEGQITQIQTQEQYNQEITQMPDKRKSKSSRKTGKRNSKKAIVKSSKNASL